MIDHADTSGQTPLMLACLTGKKDMVEWLLQKGADPTASASKDRTVLWFAERRKGNGIAELIRE